MPVALHGPAERPGGRQTFQPQHRQCGPGRVQQLLNFSGQAAQNRVLLLPQLPGQYQALHLLHMGEQVPQGEQHVRYRSASPAGRAAAYWAASWYTR